MNRQHQSQERGLEKERKALNRQRAELQRQRDFFNYQRREFAHLQSKKENRDWLCAVCIGLLLLCVITAAVTL